MVAANLLTTVIAGAVVSHAAERYGRMGLIAVTPQREILGLTVTTVVPDGKQAMIHSGGSTTRSDFGRRLSAEGETESPISALICGVPLTGPIAVRSEFAGLEAARYPQHAETQDGTLFLLRGEERVILGPVAAWGATVYRQCGDKRFVYYGAVEIALSNGESLRDGDAGAAVVTDIGTPVGLLVGEKDGLAVIAPLAHLFRVARLQPLSTLEASRHLGLAIQMGEKKALAQLLTQEVEKRNHPALLSPEIASVQSSDDLLRESSEILGIAA